MPCRGYSIPYVTETGKNGDNHTNYKNFNQPTTNWKWLLWWNVCQNGIKANYNLYLLRCIDFWTIWQSGIIWYERNVNHNFRTVINQIFSTIFWIVINLIFASCPLEKNRWRKLLQNVRIYHKRTKYNKWCGKQIIQFTRFCVHKDISIWEESWEIKIELNCIANGTK